MKKIYNKLVLVTYGYFLLLGLLLMLGTFYFGGGVSYSGLIIIMAFGIQAYFRKRLANLILGIVALAISIFWSLEFVSLGHHGGYNAFVDIMLTVSVASLLMSVVLIFSYTQLSFE